MKVGAIFALGLLAWWSAPAISGLSAAIADHSRGHVEIKHFGEPMIGMKTYHRLMRARYGVIVTEVGCMVEDGRIRYIAAYNWYTERRLLERSVTMSLVNAKETQRARLRCVRHKQRHE